MASATLPLQLPEGWEGIDQDHIAPSSLRALQLYVAIEADASYKIGTCQHCVLFEHGRPDRAWEPEGDRELDFDRDQYFALLSSLGIVLIDRQTYVCP